MYIIMWEKDDAKQLYLVLKVFHAGGPTIFSQVQRSFKKFTV